MGLDYAWQNLYKAVLGAMLSESSLQERLHGCYKDFHVLSSGEHLPPELQERWNKMLEAWNEEESTGEGTLPATLAVMSDDDARKWLTEILSMFQEVVELRAIEKQR